MSNCCLHSKKISLKGIARKLKCWYFFYFSRKPYMYVVDTHWKRLCEALLMSTHNICFCGEIRKLLCEYPTLELWKESTCSLAFIKSSRCAGKQTGCHKSCRPLKTANKISKSISYFGSFFLPIFTGRELLCLSCLLFFTSPFWKGIYSRKVCLTWVRVLWPSQHILGHVESVNLLTLFQGRLSPLSS